MFATILAACPLAVEQPENGGATGEVIAAIEEFGERVDWPLFRDAMSEELIAGIAATFQKDDGRVFKELGRIIDSIEQHLSPRETLAEFLLENPETVSRRTPPNGTASAGRRTDVSRATFKREWDGSPEVRREFGDLETFIAFRKHERAGHVRIIHGRAGGAPASGATTSTSAAPRTDVSDAELERQWQSSAQLRTEFRDDRGAFFAFARANGRGLVRIVGRSRQ